MNIFFVYILYSTKLDKYYVGQTENLEVRLQFHNNPIEDRKYTAKGIPWIVKVSMECQTKQQALKLERFIKKMKSRSFIEKLISDENFQFEITRKFNPDC